MSYFDAVSAGFRNYFDFQGRAIRSEFWWFVLFLMLVGIAAAVIDFGMGYGEEDIGPARAVSTLATIVPSLSIGARRLHDIGRSGWWQLIAITGVGIILLIYWWCQPTQPD
jgi:uncharacterized membrane protein YhaH (DUF805 family)